MSKKESLLFLSFIFNSGKLRSLFGLPPTIVFIKIGQSKRTNRQLCINQFPEIYLGKKIRPQSESVMSALTIIQEVRHSTHVHIYRPLLPGKYRMKINVSLNINILIVTERIFKWRPKKVDFTKIKKIYCEQQCITKIFTKFPINSGRTVSHIPNVGLWWESVLKIGLLQATIHSLIKDD